MLVIADERLLDLVVIEKLSGLARILTGDRRDLLAKNANSAERNIFQISDGCRDDVEGARQTLSSVSLSMEVEARG